MTLDLFGSFFDVQDKRLAQLGNPLLELNEKIDWDSFRTLLESLDQQQKKSRAGAKRKDSVMMFKGLILQNLYGLSDDQLEYQIEDRRSFKDFIGLKPRHLAPDAKTFRAFKNRLSEHEQITVLFDHFTQQMNEAGYRARKGQIIDATLIPVPIQRNSREENARIKQGEQPKDWNEAKSRQKDTEARWTKKKGKSHYGYKNHIEVDHGNKLIRKYKTTDASVHDSNVFVELLDADNSNKDVWADSAYRSEEKEAWLKEQRYRSKIQRKGCRNKPLSKKEQKGNRTRSKVRSRVEHIFGAQSNLRKKALRCIGQCRAQTEIGLMNLVYNMRRFCFLERISVS